MPRNREMPCRWFFYEVLTDEGVPFTEAGAWRFIADLLDQGHPFDDIIVLDNPPGALGYVMKKQTRYGEIYIKLQLGGDCVFGRSFHYSEY